MSAPPGHSWGLAGKSRLDPSHTGNPVRVWMAGVGARRATLPGRRPLGLSGRSEGERGLGREIGFEPPDGRGVSSSAKLSRTGTSWYHATEVQEG